MSDDFSYSYAIIGAGIAGMSAARAIRKLDESGSILLVNDEDRPPYKRTKISKKMALGFGMKDFALESEDWYREMDITRVEGEVSAIELSPRRIHLESGETLDCEKIILANGASPRLPPGIEPSTAEGIHVVRHAVQVDRIREAAASVDRVLVIGHGVLGVEVAEQLRLMGKEVELLGGGPKLLSNRLNGRLSERLAGLLSSNGIILRMDERVHAVERREGKLSVLTGKGEHTAGVVVFCTGVRPNTDLAQRAGIAVGQGVLVDEHLQTSHPGVYAAGDVAEHANGYVSFLWHAAELQGQIAGSNAAGAALTHDRRSFRMKLEVFGEYYFSMNPPQSEQGYEVVEESEGDVYRCLYFRDGRLDGALMADDKERAKEYVTAVREGWTADSVRSRLPLVEASRAT